MRTPLPTSITQLFVLCFALLALSLAIPCAARGEIVCLQCHGAQTGRGGIPVKQWRNSVHDENGISCNDCHGGDPTDAVNAMNPARGFLGVPKETAIPAFCGRCHIGIMKDYLQSAHGKALGKGGPTCVTCHHAHDIHKVTLDLINQTNCSRCHTYERAAIIKNAMQQTEANISAIGSTIQNLKEQGVDTDRYEKGLFALRNSYHALFHEVNTAKVQGESGRINQELTKISDQLTQIDNEHRQRRIIGGFVAGLFLIGALFVHLLKKTYDQ